MNSIFTQIIHLRVAETGSCKFERKLVLVNISHLYVCDTGGLNEIFLENEIDENLKLDILGGGRKVNKILLAWQIDWIIVHLQSSCCPLFTIGDRSMETGDKSGVNGLNRVKNQMTI